MKKIMKLGYVLPKKEQQVINGGTSKSSCDYYARCITSSDCISNIPGCSYVCKHEILTKPRRAGVCTAI